MGDASLTNRQNLLVSPRQRCGMRFPGERKRPQDAENPLDAGRGGTPW
jgi:hypothetical protein